MGYGITDECSHPPTPSLPCVCGHSITPQALPKMNEPDLSPSLTVSMSHATPSHTTHSPAMQLLCPPHISSSNSESILSNNLCVVAVNIKNICFNVLRLLPGPTAPPTPFNIILPPAAAFYKAADSVGASYPPFTAATCGWHAMFECIVQPSFVEYTS